jgi:hypothetical protein
MAVIPGWAWHPVVMFVLLRLGWSLLRRYLGKDPAVWLARKLKLRGTHPRRSADVIRWSVIAVAAIFVVGLQYGIAAGIGWLGPHDGDPAEMPFSISNFEFVDMDKVTFAPPGINAHFVPSRSFTGCTKAVELWPTQESSDDDLKLDFRRLIAELEVADSVECNHHYPSGDEQYISAMPNTGTIILPKQLDELHNGSRVLYGFFVWRYHFDERPDEEFIATACAYFQPLGGPVHFCPGNFNNAWRHIAN